MRTCTGLTIIFRDNMESPLMFSTFIPGQSQKPNAASKPKASWLMLLSSELYSYNVRTNLFKS